MCSVFFIVSSFAALVVNPCNRNNEQELRLYELEWRRLTISANSRNECKIDGNSRKSGGKTHELDKNAVLLTHVGIICERDSFFHLLVERVKRKSG